MAKFAKSKLKLVLIFGLLVLLVAPVLLIPPKPREDSEFIVPHIDAQSEAERFIQKAAEDYFYHEFEKAAVNYRKAIALFEADNKLKNAAKTYEYLGDLYKAAKNFEAAVNNYRRAVDYHAKIGNPTGRARALKKAGDLYMDRENYKSAGEWYEKALATVNGLEPHIVKGKVHEAAGQFYWKTKRLLQAIEQFNHARAIFETLRFQMGYDHMTTVLSVLKKEKKLRPHASRPPSGD